ncbi:MAG: hypothetical protein ACRDG2_04585, partial [Actinomycetota bacterium]
MGGHRALALGDVRRRPSGEPPPLPRELGRSGKFWLGMTAYFLFVLIAVVVFDGFGDVFDRFNTERLLDVAALRTAWLTDLAEFVAVLGNPWTIRILRWGTILALVVFKR